MYIKICSVLTEVSLCICYTHRHIPDFSGRNHNSIDNQAGKIIQLQICTKLIFQVETETTWIIDIKGINELSLPFILLNFKFPLFYLGLIKEFWWQKYYSMAISCFLQEIIKHHPRKRKKKMQMPWKWGKWFILTALIFSDLGFFFKSSWDILCHSIFIKSTPLSKRKALKEKNPTIIINY